MLKVYRSYAAYKARRSRGAFDLTELALYLVAGIILLIGIIALFSNVFGSSKAVEAQNQFNTIVTEVRSLYSSQSSYTGLTTAVLASSGGLSQSWLPTSSTIANPYKGAITVTGTGTNFTVTDGGLTPAACEAIATQQSGSDVTSVSVNTSAVTLPAAVTQVDGFCSGVGPVNLVSVTMD